MTAKEIRKQAANSCHIPNEIFLAEIAAQLAELNKILRDKKPSVSGK